MVTGSDHRDGSASELRLWESADGSRWEVCGALELVSPSYTAAHPRLPVVYVVSEQAVGTVSSIALSGSGAMAVSSTVSAEGAEPCHLAVNASGTRLAVANYGSGTAAVFELGPEGTISSTVFSVQLHGSGPNVERQESSHAHHVAFAGDALTVTDLGGDRLERCSPNGDRLAPVTLPPGFGPRHWVRSGGRVLVVGELTAELGVLDADGEHWAGATPTTHGTEPAQPSGIATTDGWVYVANRGPDTVLRIRPGDGPPTTWQRTETPSGGGSPRDIAIVAGRLAVANQDTSRISLLDRATLQPLASLGHDAVASVLELPQAHG